MKTMNWLLRREFWEHKGGFVWAPLVAALIMVLLVGGTIGYGMATGKMRGDSVSVTINGVTTYKPGMQHVLTPEQRTQVAEVAANSYVAAGAPILVVLPIVAFFYCLAALYDDRRDRSILFWKSLPISDTETVLSKVATVLVIAPLISIGIAVGTALILSFFSALAASQHGVSLFGPVLSNVNFYLSPLYLVAMLPVYFLWALPSAGWLMLVSSWAKSKVILWAVGVPVFTAVLLKYMDYLLGLYGSTIHADWIIDNFIETLLFNLAPGSWFINGHDVPTPTPSRGLDLLGMLTYSWATLARPTVWVGAAAGVAMLAGAIRLRRWRDEG
jgi:ABC-2 type transport system permease protein